MTSDESKPRRCAEPGARSRSSNGAWKRSSPWLKTMSTRPGAASGAMRRSMNR